MWIDYWTGKKTWLASNRTVSKMDTLCSLKMIHPAHEIYFKQGQQPLWDTGQLWSAKQARWGTMVGKACKNWDTDEDIKEEMKINKFPKMTSEK